MRFLGKTNRLFVCMFPGGVVFADRHVMVDGDYKRLAFLPYRTLEPEIVTDCPADLRAEIELEVARYRRRAGTDLQITTSGQTVRLGGERIKESADV